MEDCCLGFDEGKGEKVLGGFIGYVLVGGGIMVGEGGLDLLGEGGVIDEDLGKGWGFERR